MLRPSRIDPRGFFNNPGDFCVVFQAVCLENVGDNCLIRLEFKGKGPCGRQRFWRLIAYLLGGVCMHNNIGFLQGRFRPGCFKDKPRFTVCNFQFINPATKEKGIDLLCGGILWIPTGPETHPGTTFLPASLPVLHSGAFYRERRMAFEGSLRAATHKAQNE